MENCPHLRSFNIEDKKEILNPERWKCSICGFTESVWACLECCNVACGRQSNQHAQLHNSVTKHPIALEINNQYLYCYICDDYILNDTPEEDVQELRRLLQTVTKQSLEGLGQVESPRTKCIHMMTRSQSIELSVAEDKEATAVCHYEKQLLFRFFTLWRNLTHEEKMKKLGTMPSTPPRSRRRLSSSLSPPLTRYRRSLCPGVVGLRNLGNTCYMNSVLQVLSHVEVFRISFLNLEVLRNSSSNNNGHAAPKRRSIQRQIASESFEHLTSTPEPSAESPEKRRREGLSGGGSVLAQANPVKVRQSKNNQPMARELHELLRRMWSGKWAKFGPHDFQTAIWRWIPDFRGHEQQDAQEFLSMLVSTVKEELTELIPRRRGRPEVDLITKMFQGQLVSTVTCKACNNSSSTKDDFYDLSLEFPTRYQMPCTEGSEDPCHVTEMLAKFTDIEDLGEVYKCEHCNSMGMGRSRSKGKQTIFTSATKQLLVHKLPQVLWLHLKRFRWVGVDREKIAAHVAFDRYLDLSPYTEHSHNIEKCGARYQLCGVVIHHGKGFARGHYTALCWNSQAGQAVAAGSAAGSWVNFNDETVNLTTEDKVLNSQAYILVYCRCPPAPASAKILHRQSSIVHQVDEEVSIRLPCTEELTQLSEVVSQPEEEVLQQPAEDLSQAEKKRSRRSKTKLKARQTTSH